MFSEKELYVYQCITEGKRPSSRRVKKLNGDLDYVKIMKQIYPNEGFCLNCGKETKVYKLTGPRAGFRRFCSVKCAMRYNNKNQDIIEKRVITFKNNHTKDLSAKTKKEIEKLYKELYTLKEIADITGESLCKVKSHLKDNNIFDDKRKKIIKQNQAKQKMSESIDLLLEYTENNSHFTGQELADYANCSKDFACKTMRKQGNPIPNNVSISSQERKLSSFLEGKVEYLSNTRKILDKKELDFYFPSYNLAIEVNGVYWHSYDEECKIRNKNKLYHLQKTIECNEKGIHLLHFYDYEIDHHFDKVCSIINSFIGRNEKIYARKCKIVDLDSKTYYNFCEKNHIQGGIQSSIKYGLVYDDEIVAVAGFSKSRYDKKIDFELIRYCSILGSNVVGGLSKLFRHFLKKHNNLSVISYAQRRLYTGKSYEKIGFKLTKISPPSYMWVNKKGDYLSRYKTQKHKLKEEGTEKEIMKRRGYMQIYECGNYVYLYQPIISSGGRE